MPGCLSDITVLLLFCRAVCLDAFVLSQMTVLFGLLICSLVDMLIRLFFQLTSQLFNQSTNRHHAAVFLN
jgi:hypothetical protein